MELATEIASHHEGDAQAHAPAVAAARKAAAALVALRALLSSNPTHLSYAECLAEALAKPPAASAAGPDDATALLGVHARGDAARKVAAALAALRALLSSNPTHLGFVECLAEALAKPPDVNAVGPDGATALLLACARGDAAVAEEVLSVGADHAAEGEVWQPAHYAADGELIKEAGKYSASPLTMVAFIGNSTIARMLLARNGLDVNKATTDNGSTPLFMACQEGHDGVVKLLLAHDGIDANKAMTNDGTTPLCIACQNDHDEVVKLMLAHAGIDANKATTDNGITPLYVACQSGHDEVLRLLLGHDGIDVNKAMTNDGTTPLFMACQRGHDEIVKLMLTHDGIDANKATTDDGCTSLSVACQNGHDEVVKLLLAHGGIDANKARADGGITPLFLTCASGHDGIVKLLLAHDGIDANKGRTDNGVNPLWMACYNDHDEVVKLMLAHDGIDANQATTDAGITPLYIACHKGYDGVVKLMLAYGGIEVNKARTDDGTTPLHAAVHSGNLCVAQHLVTCGADVHATDSLNLTATQYAYATAAANQPTLAAWLNAVSTWSSLRIAAGCRLHREVATLLRQGRMDPDSFTIPEILAAVATSKAQPAALPWDGAPPVCRRTVALVADATRGWHRTTHWLHHAKLREAVFTVLAVADRLYAKAALPQEEEPPQQAKRRRRSTRAAAAAAAAEIASVPLPTLPPEIWLHCMGFVLRSWWAVLYG